MAIFIRVIFGPLLLLLLVEALFRAGTWESMISANSHSGVSVQLKKKIRLQQQTKPIDFITIGDSRTEHGLNHASIANTARENGFVHANLSMGGSHWMTFELLTKWLEREHVNVRGGIIATEIALYAEPGNGAYELGLVEPFRGAWDFSALLSHVPIGASQPETWGSISAIFQQREDIKSFVKNPLVRLNLDRVSNVNLGRDLFANTEDAGDLCAYGVKDFTACDRINNDPLASELNKRLCKEMRSASMSRANFKEFAKQNPTPEFMTRNKVQIRKFLKSLNWEKRPIIVLMPMPKIWKEHTAPIGLKDWALEILGPLVQSGEIVLVDMTDKLDKADGSDCRFYRDFYHQNQVGRDELTAMIMPTLKAELYAN